jgi:hypothetical protein
MAEHGRMGLNGLLGSLDPAVDYESFFINILDVHPAYMLHWSTMVSGVMPKYIETIPMLRLMSGSNKDRDLEKGFMNALLRNMAEDGLIYDRSSPDRPWNVGIFYGKKDWDEDYANLAGNGRGLAGLCFQYQVTGDEKWKRLAKKTAERMLELAIIRGDIAYYPNPGLGNDFSYPRLSGWGTTEPPQKPDEGFEGATVFYLFQPLRGFTRYYVLTGDERFLDLSRKFVNLGMEKKFWGADNDMNKNAGAERGHFRGHYHGNLAALRGLLDYALVANDNRLKAFVRDSYEYARHNGIHRLGIFPTGNQDIEGCTIGDMVGMAVALTDAGLGDYWDDVEQYARNGLISAQCTDIDELKRVSEAGPHRPKNANWGGVMDARFSPGNRGVLPGQEVHYRVLERSIGAFGHLDGAHYLKPQMMHCCTANGNQSIYFAWEGIVRKSGDSANVNMWLNRQSPWVDVWSWLPYEGKLVVQNKGMRRISVRIPAWVKRGTIRSKITGKDAEPHFVGNRIVFDGLKGNEQLELKVPVALEKARYSLVNLNERANIVHRYDCEFKGNTAISVKWIKPAAPEEHVWYRLFRREQMRAPKAPMKAMPAYVHPENILHWSVI